ncbi:hypothetical protein [Micromonospora eburnea]|uniref:Uncharacterized protein n=1 Tax=Micromonospora eburnea TaxID=227316 RepID=A0A1C6U2H6_9ACTN|nr:hypothetical protein [Micromonospora eburnea]SCL48242.1 hypothetical protein GA0070604_1658 [Micromonospora eburnea]
MSTQAASTRPMNRPAQEAPNRMAMQEAQTRQMPMMEDGHRHPAPSPGTETKHSLLTTEFWVYAIAVAGVIVAAFWPGGGGNGLNLANPNLSWWFLTVLTGAYLFSRGLAKAGSERHSMAERRAARR